MSEVRVENGRLSGLEVDGLHWFRNIPYAAPPFGPRRFQPPVRPDDWDGVRDATKPGPAAPQPDGGDPIAELYSPTETGEDCLTLEVWTPDPGANSLPVMVHIHGGGYTFGAGSLPGYSGRTFARDGVVHVGINYRLGVEGFLYLGEGHENLGLRDQTAALEWVQRNIAAFGGDPARVTIFGQSGGAVSVMVQLALPASRGLFAGAIAQSGCSMPSVDAGEAMRITRQVARGLRVAPTPEGLAAVPVARTTAAAFTALKRYAGVGLALGDRRSLLLSPFRAVHGTGTLPVNPVESARRTPGVPLLAGTARNEMAPLIGGIAQAVPAIAPFIRRGIKRALQLGGPLAEAYSDGPRHIDALAPLVEAGWTDWGFRIPTIRLLEARVEPSWLYEFRWQPEGLPPASGAFHAIDLPFVRDDLDAVLAVDAARPIFGTNPPRELAQRMHADFIRFATTGDPGWPQYDGRERITMLYDVESRATSDPAGVEREAWVGLR